MSIGGLRVRLQFSPPLPSNRCWYEVSYTDRHTLISDLATSLWHDFDLKKLAKAEQLKLEVDGFELGRSSTTKGIVREGDLIVVSCVQGGSVASPRIDVRIKRKRRVSFSSTEGSDSKSKRTKTVTNDTVSGNKKIEVASEVDKIQVGTKDTVEAEDDGSSDSSSDETSSGESSEESSKESSEESSKESSEESSDEASEESEESSDESSEEASKKPSVVKSSEKEQKGDSSKQANLKESKVGSKENGIRVESRTLTVNGVTSQKEVGRPQMSVKSSETGQVGKRISRSPAGATISDIAPPLSLGKKKKRQMEELINHQRVHVRFADADDEEEHAAEQDVSLGKKNATLSQDSVNVGRNHVRFGDGEDNAVTEASEPSHTSIGRSRVIYTQVYLEDDQKNKGKRRRNRSRYSMEGQTTTDGEEVNGSARPTSVSAAAVEKGPKKNYAAMPALIGSPVSGQTIAYKILEMSDTYCPVISDFKEGLVLSVDPRRSLVTLKLKNSFRPATTSNEEDEEVAEGMLGKFDLPPDDWYILEGAQHQEIITLELASLIDTRIVS
ncbi:uncharacterized protein SPPG_05798 [Spizellomyces punctatus DAOM BR117]|uniref:Coilin tudor domain-containing protein n=1 Tax=Spizellomyces punctatus (strain DAOM BR117) TaxID=645134 RepID=A0A0L0HCV5_SPIPD|nr:uncharacterized protein SPPG_05798 [Spizellomyces punctatus DAOM BR117]KNC98821.1 hypothetical protein SPPG_05798 [Spizellomyces punctatus DAOM BR117]|eukprot:XP_016606861.1 hypothetical protein SPPG_05798 [Spizellomyces punctatus DAOM BR117]